MSTIGYGYGSEWHLLRYLGYHREELSEYVLKATGATKVEWKDFRFSSSCSSLQDDEEWKGVQVIKDDIVTASWQRYWPSTGTPPSWDAIAILHFDDGQEELLLVEAKAHVDELYSKCTASTHSLATITSAFDDTASNVTTVGITTPAWYNDYYQYANRLAVLNFLLNQCRPAVPSRLLYIYFCGERVAQMPGRVCPSNAIQWHPHLNLMYTSLDLKLTQPLMLRVHSIFVPVNPKC